MYAAMPACARRGGRAGSPRDDVRVQSGARAVQEPPRRRGVALPSPNRRPPDRVAPTLPNRRRERGGDRIMQDHDVTRPDLVGDERVSILPALAEGILLLCTERGAEQRDSAEHRVDALHQPDQRLAQLQQRPVRRDSLIPDPAQAVLQRVRGRRLRRRGGDAPHRPACQLLDRSAAGRVHPPRAAVRVRRVELLDHEARHGMSPRTSAVVYRPR